jgi:hypothetical protein
MKDDSLIIVPYTPALKEQIPEHSKRRGISRCGSKIWDFQSGRE